MDVIRPPSAPDSSGYVMGAEISIQAILRSLILNVCERYAWYPTSGDPNEYGFHALNICERVAQTAQVMLWTPKYCSRGISNCGF